MSTKDTTTGRLAWARRRGAEIAQTSWYTSLSMTRMADKVSESLARQDDDLIDAAMDAALEWWEAAADAADGRRDREIEGIAQRILDVDALADEGIEDQDEVAVARGDLAEALRAAYAAGFKAGQAEVK